MNKMASYTIKENYIAKEAQVAFPVQTSFNSDCIEVRLNNLLLAIETDYFPNPEAGIFTLNVPAQEGDSVSVTNTIANSNLEVISSSHIDKPNSMFKKYTTINKLKFNNKYQVKINIGSQSFEWNFNTRMTPMFSTVKKVLEDCGEFLEGFTEEYIGSVIHRNSIELLDLVNGLAEENIMNVTIDQNEDGYYNTTYRLVNNWVRLKTEMDLIYAKYYGESLRYGSVSKSIGDISIEKSVKLPYIDELLKRIQKQFEVIDEAIRNSGLNFVGSAVKGAIRFTYNERGNF